MDEPEFWLGDGPTSLVRAQRVGFGHGRQQGPGGQGGRGYEEGGEGDWQDTKMRSPDSPFIERLMNLKDWDLEDEFSDATPAGTDISAIRQTRAVGSSFRNTHSPWRGWKKTLRCSWTSKRT